MTGCGKTTAAMILPLSFVVPGALRGKLAASLNRKLRLKLNAKSNVKSNLKLSSTLAFRLAASFALSTSLGLSAHAQSTAPAAPVALVSPDQVVIAGDAIPAPLTTAPADAARGRAIITNRQVGLCLLCHSGPFPDQRFQGDLAPTLAGAGSRWSEGQLRLRLVDASRANPSTIMPSYYQAAGLNRVANAWQGKTILSAQQIEDVIAFLRTMRQ